jgi:YfiH family protein
MLNEMVQSPLLRSLPGITHGFVSNHTPGAQGALDAAEPTVATVKQVHRDLVLWANGPEKRAREADGLGTHLAGLAVGVYSADCTPILLAATDAHGLPIAVMAVHAGWRGTALEIGAKSLAEFALATPLAAKFYAALGPCISFESFEVGEEVVAAFPESLRLGQAKFLREVEGKKKYLFDLPGENKRQLRDCAARLGLSLQVDFLPYCTLKLRDQFPSYRRDREKAGRILSYLSFQR